MKRIQRKRTKGWRMPENTVYVGRGSKWGNPFRVGDFTIDNNEDAVRQYRSWILQGMRYYREEDDSFHYPPTVKEIKQELAGKDLACWCGIVDKYNKYIPCHADILLSLANDLTLEEVKNENLREKKLL